MEFRDEEDKIFTIFSKEFSETRSFYDGFDTFIKRKNLGIEVAKLRTRQDTTLTYKIVNEKEWFLNKIKYGI